MGIHHFETSTTASWKRSLDRKRPLGYHSNSYSWKGKERTPPFGQTARVCTGKQTNLGFSEGILPRQLEFSFFDGEVNVNFEWSTFCALGRRTNSVYSRTPLSQKVSNTPFRARACNRRKQTGLALRPTDCQNQESWHLTQKINDSTCNGALICQYVMGPLNTSSCAPKTLKRAGWQGFWREHFCRTWREDFCHFTHQFVSCSFLFRAMENPLTSAAELDSDPGSPHLDQLPPARVISSDLH